MVIEALDVAATDGPDITVLEVRDQVNPDLQRVYLSTPRRDMPLVTTLKRERDLTPMPLLRKLGKRQGFFLHASTFVLPQLDFGLDALCDLVGDTPARAAMLLPPTTPIMDNDPPRATNLPNSRRHSLSPFLPTGYIGPDRLSHRCAPADSILCSEHLKGSEVLFLDVHGKTDRLH
jgi:hypothetical protein